jgi:hypothetical protein
MVNATVLEVEDTFWRPGPVKTPMRMVLVAPKPEPVTVTWVPTGPEEGLSEAIAGTGSGGAGENGTVLPGRKTMLAATTGTLFAGRVASTGLPVMAS